MAGITIGSFNMVMMCVAIVCSQPHEKARRSQCMNNEREIGKAIAMYAGDHNGQLPPAPDALSNYFHGSMRIFFCPSAKDKTHYSYELTGVTNRWMTDPKIIILRENSADHPGNWIGETAGGNVLYDDGHVEWIRESHH